MNHTADVSTELSSSECLLAIATMAALADGAKSEGERQQLATLASELGEVDAGRVLRQVLMGRLDLATAAAGLTTERDRLLACEMARGVCEADGQLLGGEEAFLADLRGRLGIVDQPEFPSVPVETAPAALSAPDNAQMILKYAILNGALELLPETMATMAIIPMQMKMVYRIGKSHGAPLDAASIRDFLLTAGVGLASQAVEGMARKLFRSAGRGLAGKLGGRVGDQLAGSAMAFASTYAIGHLAETYYGGGRKLPVPALKDAFASLAAKAKDLHATYLPEMRKQAESLNAPRVMAMLRGG